jgi:hypothetical protein
MESFGNNIGTSNPRQVLITATIIILIIIVLYYLLMMLFGKASKTVYLTNTMIDIMEGNKGMTTSADVMDKEAGYAEYSYGFWLYMKDFNKNIRNPRLILRRMKAGTPASGTTPATSSVCNPCVFMYPNTNTLGIRVSAGTEQLQDPTDAGLPSTGFYDETRACDIPDIPLQKWVHIAVNVRTNAMDVFVNGKLFRSCTLSGQVEQINGVGMSILDFGDIYLPGAFVGGVFVKNQPLNSQEAYDIYSSGPGVSVGGLLESTFGLKEVRFTFNDKADGASSYGITF